MSSKISRTISALGAAALLSTTLGVATVATAEAKAPASSHRVSFDNCTELHRTFKHGVGKRHARDHTSGDPVTNFKRSNKIYARAMRANSTLDADKDKIACEAA